jgi:hypothetical protein
MRVDSEEEEELKYSVTETNSRIGYNNNVKKEEVRKESNEREENAHFQYRELLKRLSYITGGNSNEGGNNEVRNRME